MGSVHAKSFNEPEMTPDSSGNISLDGIKARVDRIHVDGLGRTRDDIVVSAVKELFRPQDFSQLILKIHEVRGRLQSSGLFKNVSVLIDTSRGSEATQNGLEVTFYVREHNRVAFGVNSIVGQNEGSLVTGLSLPNCFGRAEKLQAEYAYGMKKSTGFNLTFTKAFINPANPLITAACFKQSADVPWSGFSQIERGVLVDAAFESAPKVQHNIRWEGIWRDISILAGARSFDVREQMGHSLKSAIKGNTWTRLKVTIVAKDGLRRFYGRKALNNYLQSVHTLSVDHRDDPILPNTGVYLKIYQELAGIGGDIGFFKNEGHLQFNFPLPLESVFQCAVSGGMLTQRSHEMGYNIADRFFLGAPLYLRGFEMRGAGPHDQGCALGSDAYWSAAAHIYVPPPFRPGKGGIGDIFRVHFFANVGNIGPFQFSYDYQQLLANLWERKRWTLGLGIVTRIGPARVELNYCFPMEVQPKDRACHGLQFGVGVSFL